MTTHVVCSSIICKDDKFLLVQESKEICKGMYNLPAGKLDPGESILEAAVREAKEETGLSVTPGKLVGIYQRPASAEGTNATHFVFAADKIEGDIIRTEEHPIIEYFSLGEIEQMNKEGKLRSKYILPALRDYIAGKGIDNAFLRTV